MRPARAFVAVALALPALSGTVGCQAVGYYSQAIGGHLKLMRAREPIEDVIADGATDPELARRLAGLVEARRFAIDTLALPDTDSYRTYAATGRRYVTWNVVAAEEFSLDPYTWCFPVAGCVSYRGYYAEGDAREYADGLVEAGYDVTVGGASAYSTLGWFDDPVLDTMLRAGELRTVGTLFHEMAHQRLYVQDDSDFNEAYATFVERQGVREWLAAHGAGTGAGTGASGAGAATGAATGVASGAAPDADAVAAYEASLGRGEAFAALLADTRAALVELYAQELDEAAMREAKRAAFERMRARYEDLKADWGGYAGYDGWFARELNNARLVAVSTYRRRVPAFEALFEESGRDLRRFHAAAEALGELPAAARTARLDELGGAAGGAGAERSARAR